MSFFATRAGALAPVGLMATTLLGAIGASAYAQDHSVPKIIPEEVLETAIPVDGAAPADPEPADSEPQVRFVAQPVIQHLPEPAVVADIDPANAPTLVALVDALDPAPALSDDMQCLAQAIYFEARGEPVDGQLAVAQVIINRATSSQFPDDYCSVVTQRSQFSFVKGGRLPQPNLASQAWGRAKAVARIAHRGLWDSEAGDALYFHATHVRPRWARNLQTRAMIDRHIFYR